MKDEILKLISLGDTENALKKLSVIQPGETVLLQAQYANGLKQFNLTLIDYSEWQKIVAKVNYAMVELANKQPVTTSVSPAAQSLGKKVFISYSWNDKEMVTKVKTYLESNGLMVTIDDEALQAAESISGFIEKNIKQNHFILSITSKNSLKSGWVGKESTLALFAELFSDTRFIPVCLDKSFNDDNFFIKTLKSINKDIEATNGKIAEANKLGAGGRTFQDKLNRLTDLRSNLDTIIQKLRSVNTLPLFDDHFEKSMQKVLKIIQENN